jgi:hypothetical protein
VEQSLLAIPKVRLDVHPRAVEGTSSASKLLIEERPSTDDCDNATIYSTLQIISHMSGVATREFRY